MKVLKYQEGGTIPTEQPMIPPQQTQEDPIMQIANMMAQALQTGDCNIAMQACDSFLQLLTQASRESIPQEPVNQIPEGEPVFKKGGKIVKRKKCGSKK